MDSNRNQKKKNYQAAKVKITSRKNARNNLPNIGNGTGSGQLYENQPSTSESRAVGNKRQQYFAHLDNSSGSINKQAKQDPEENGPLYKREPKSIVLYEAPIGKKYDEKKKPNGIVDVIVHRVLQRGKDDDLDLKLEQVDGLRFLWKSFSEKKGVILAHEMGLGKTRTTITFILTLLEQSEGSAGKSTPGAKKIVILAPKNAISATWEAELDKWRPIDMQINYESIFSNTKNGNQMIREFQKNGKHILILSYDTFRIHAAEFHAFKNPVDVVIYDEAHLLKNDITQRSKMLQDFKTKLRVGLTGTPFQNTLLEFCNLVYFFQPSAIESNYKAKYCTPIQKDLNKHQELREPSQKIIDSLKNKFFPVVQYKKNCIPVEKHELIVCVGLKGSKDPNLPEMSMQSVLYKKLSELFKQLENPLSFYPKLDILKKLCIHPQYAYKTIAQHPSLNEAKRIYDTSKRLSEFKDADGLFKLLFSGKLVTLFEMLKNVKKNYPEEKALVVSYSTEIFDYISEICKDEEIMERMGSWKYVRYDGSMGDADRKLSLERFNRDNDYFVLLLSGKAGGTSLNLTRANHVFLLDPDWNPSNDKQVLARVYRPGQEKPVFLYRFLSTGTIEETIFLLQLSKEEIESYLKSKDVKGNLKLPFSEQDLLDYHPNTKSYLRERIEQLCQEQETKFSTQSQNITEMRYFAQELSCAKQYDSKESVPSELDILKNSWPTGMTYAYHKRTRVIDTISQGILNMANALVEPLIVKVEKPGTSILQGRNSEIYRIKSSPKGVVLIINNRNYMRNHDGSIVNDPLDSDMTRFGAEMDEMYLKDLFRQMGYKIMVANDPQNLEELEEVLENFKRKLIHLKSDVALMFVMGHGIHSGVMLSGGVDTINVWTNIIYKFTDEAFEEMKGKPKAFFFQSCQTFSKRDLSSKSKNINPEHIFVSLAAPPGSPTYRCPVMGSVYINTLVDIMMKHACKLDIVKMHKLLLDVMTEASKTSNFATIPTNHNFLKKKLRLL